MSDANRALSKAEADQSIASGKLENLGLAVARFEEEASNARQRLIEADRAVAELGDLDAARNEVEDTKMTVEAARITSHISIPISVNTILSSFTRAMLMQRKMFSINFVASAARQLETGTVSQITAS